MPKGFGVGRASCCRRKLGSSTAVRRVGQTNVQRYALGEKERVPLVSPLSFKVDGFSRMVRLICNAMRGTMA